MASQVNSSRSGLSLPQPNCLLWSVKTNAITARTLPMQSSSATSGTFCDVQLAGLLGIVARPLEALLRSPRRKRLVRSGFSAIILSVAMIVAA